MRLLFIGNFRPEHSTENDLLKTLRIMGHDVVTVQEDAHDADLAGELKDPDLVLWCHTHGWLNDGLDFEVNAPTVAFTLDLFRGLARHDPKYVETHPWFRCQYFFSPDDPEWLRSHGVNAYWSPPAVLSTSCYVAAPDPLHQAFNKIVFVGSRTYHREHAWRGELLAYLEETYGADFVLFDHSSGMRGHALNVLYASAAIVVGDSCFASPDSAYTSDRLFESLGRGANLVYPDIAWKPYGSLRGFVHAYTPGDFGSLGDAIDEAIANGDVGGRFLAGRRSRYIAEHHTYTHHTYTHRLQAILDVVPKERA